MLLSGAQYKQVQDALIAAFGDEDNLRQMLRLQMNVGLEAIAKPGNIVQRTFDVVVWAATQGRLGELVHAACAQNPQNSELLALAEAVKGWRIAAAEPAEAAPYKGLAFYGVGDAALFFGRAALTAELVTHLKDHHFLAVVGASGSGKSSVVRAGVMPTLQKGPTLQEGEIAKGSDKWAVHIVTPTARPLQALAAELTKDSESVTAQASLMEDMSKDFRSLDLFVSRLLARTGARRLLLVVDQFEELFTLCRDRAEQQAYVDNLLAAAVPQGVTTVILTLRADFYASCAEFANLRTALQDYQKYIGPMSRDELRTAIEKPAQANDWDFEPGLVDAILDDVEGEAGSLPLLSHALLETWQRRSGRLLTFGGYHAAGGVHGAIAKTADGVYAELPPDQQAIARSIFLRLTTLGEGTQDTRRRAPLPELLGKGAQAAQVQAVLKRLEDERLVTAERAAAGVAGGEESSEAVYVDVTHEALIREWPRLNTWLNEDREGLLVHRRLTEAAQEWQDMARDAGALFRGARLVQTAEWAAAHAGDINDLEREFLETSQAQVDAEQRARERIQREREEAQKRALADAEALAAEQRRRAAEQAAAAHRLQQRNRGLLAALAVALAAFVLAGIFFWQAQDRAAEAQANADLANAKLQDLAGEQLVTEAKRFRAELNATAAISSFEAAYAIDPTLILLSDEISDTLRYVATAYMQEGENILCEALFDEPQKCAVPVAGQAVVPITTSVVISQPYLAWAQDVAPQIVGWSSYTSTVQQQAVISATALYSQALALHPPSDTPVYVWIAPGSFEMGSTAEQCDKAGIGACPSIEQPPHPVQLDGYWIQRTEVTNEQYKRCVDAGGCPEAPSNPFWELPRSARLPVTHVYWNQASAYAAWVGGRLPTEAEWEYACRGGDGRIYPWGDEPPAKERLNYNYELGGTTDVGTYPSGANDLYDMAGNAYEWTADWYGADYYRNSPERNPGGPEVGGHRTLRGGGWLFGGDLMRCAVRYDFRPSDPSYYIGFRFVSPGF